MSFMTLVPYSLVHIVEIKSFVSPIKYLSIKYYFILIGVKFNHSVL